MNDSTEVVSVSRKITNERDGEAFKMRKDDSDFYENLPEIYRDLEGEIYNIYCFRAGMSGYKKNSRAYGLVGGNRFEDFMNHTMDLLPAYDQWILDLKKNSMDALYVIRCIVMENKKASEISTEIKFSRAQIKRLYKFAMNEYSILTGRGDILEAPDRIDSPLNLYVIGTPDKSSLKIGISDNPFKRIKAVKQDLKRGKLGISPTDLRVWFIKDMRGENAYEFEKALHHHFEEDRIGGEWFSASLDDIIAVARILIPHTKDYELC